MFPQARKTGETVLDCSSGCTLQFLTLCSSVIEQRTTSDRHEVRPCPGGWGTADAVDGSFSLSFKLQAQPTTPRRSVPQCASDRSSDVAQLGQARSGQAYYSAKKQSHGNGMRYNDSQMTLMC